MSEAANGVNLENTGDHGSVEMAKAPDAVDKENIRSHVLVKMAEAPNFVNQENIGDHTSGEIMEEEEPDVINQENIGDHISGEIMEEEEPDVINQENIGDLTSGEIMEEEEPDVINQGTIRDHISVESSDLTRQLATSIVRELGNVSPSVGQRCCIYRVHKNLRKLNECAYMPELVSIGPFHHGEEALQEMEELKLWYMNALLSRTENREIKLQACIEAISSKEDEARKYYSQPVEPDRKTFVKMMVVDGLFIIEFFLGINGYVPRDGPLFRNSRNVVSVIRDIKLLENQLPMFVLEILFGITMENQEVKPLNELAIRFFFNHLNVEGGNVIEPNLNKEGKHLLDLLSQTFHTLLFREEPHDETKLVSVPSATELRLAGVKFKRGSIPCNFLHVTFYNGVLEIPHILINDETDSLLRNLIAFEQCGNGSTSHLTSYVFLMDSLIKSSKDVELLCKHGIITNHVGNNECALNILSKLCRELSRFSFYFYYLDLCNQLRAFYDAPLSRLRVAMARKFSRNMKIMALFLTCIGTNAAVVSLV